MSKYELYSICKTVDEEQEGRIKHRRFVTNYSFNIPSSHNIWNGELYVFEIDFDVLEIELPSGWYVDDSSGVDLLISPDGTSYIAEQTIIPINNCPYIRYLTDNNTYHYIAFPFSNAYPSEIEKYAKYSFDNNRLFVDLGNFNIEDPTDRDLVVVPHEVENELLNQITNNGFICPFGDDDLPTTFHEHFDCGDYHFKIFTYKSDDPNHYEFDAFVWSGSLYDGSTLTPLGPGEYVPVKFSNSFVDSLMQSTFVFAEDYYGKHEKLHVIPFDACINKNYEIF